jgi:hypothetical protein
VERKVVGGMMQAMVLVGVLVICAVSGVVLAYRPRWTPGPEEPTGSYALPTPPVPSLPPVIAAPSVPPVAAAPGRPPAAVHAPVKPSQPLPTEIVAAPPVPAVPPVRRSRNSGFNRFAPAAVRRITPGVYR